jgi:hypothetical protein
MILLKFVKLFKVKLFILFSNAASIANAFKWNL